MSQADLRLLTIAGAAYEMQVSERQINEWVKEGKLRVILVGTDRRIPAQSVLDFYRTDAA